MYMYIVCTIYIHGTHACTCTFTSPITEGTVDYLVRSIFPVLISGLRQGMPSGTESHHSSTVSDCAPTYSFGVCTCTCMHVPNDKGEGEHTCKKSVLK